MTEPRAVYYDGRHGAEIQVTLRDPMTAARFTPDRPLKLLGAEDVQDLLSPQVGGGAFHACVPLAEAGSGAEGLEGALVVPYLPKGAPAEADPVRYLVLTPEVRRGLQKRSDGSDRSDGLDRSASEPKPRRKEKK